MPRPRSELCTTGESACRPGSVRPPKRADGHPSGTAIADGLVRSTREHRAGRPQALAQSPRPERRGSLLTLLRVGFTKPPESPQALVVSYTTVSPLPPARPGAVCSLWHCPAGHPGSALPTTLPCGARTFLAGLPARPPGRLARRAPSISAARQPWPAERASEPGRARRADRDRPWLRRRLASFGGHQMYSSGSLRLDVPPPNIYQCDALVIPLNMPY